MSTDAAWRTPLAFALWLLVFACAESSTGRTSAPPKRRTRRSIRLPTPGPPRIT